MDPLSDVLSLLKPRSYGCGGIDTGGEVSIHFPQHDGIKCYAVVSGRAWLVVDGVAEAAHLAAGDCFVLPRGLPFRLTSDLSLPSVDYRTVLADRPPGVVISFNGGGECMIVGGHFALDGLHAEMLLGVLPPIVHLRTDADRVSLRWSLDRMMHELREPQPGGLLVIEHIAQMMLVQALRLHMREAGNGRVGWLFALSDKQMGSAISAMHAAPSQRWTLASLAACAGMSRTSFATRFKQTVGASPIDYLTRWRMMVAGEKLLHSREPISAIAPALGYDSESAFSTAFKRVMGCSPRQYGRQRGSRLANPVGVPSGGAHSQELIAA